MTSRLPARLSLLENLAVLGRKDPFDTWPEVNTTGRGPFDRLRAGSSTPLRMTRPIHKGIIDLPGSVSRFLQSNFDPGPGIEQIAESIADEIERQHRQHNRSGREQDQMRRVQEMNSGVVEHRAPARRRRRYAEAEETHGSLRQNCAGNADGTLHNDWLHDVGEDVAENDSQVARAQSPRGLDEFPFANRQDLGAHQPGIADPSAERQSENQVEQARAAEGYESDGQQDSGERQKRVNDDDVDEAVEQAPVVAGEGAYDEAEQQGEGDHASADQHGDAGAVDDTGEDIAAEFIGAEPVGARGGHQAGWQIDVSGVLRGEPRGEQGAA